MKGLVLRSISGIVYVAVIVVGLTMGEICFKIFISLFTILGIMEWTRLTNDTGSPLNMLLDIIGATIAVIGLSALAGGSASAAVYGACYLTYLILRLVTQLYTRDKSALNSLAYSLMGQLYIALPLGLMSFIYYHEGYGSAALLAMFIMIWLNDTGAFCVGSTLGRHKLFARVSPKKSWEGFIGGVIFAIASAFLFKYCFGSHYQSLSLAEMLAMGAIVGCIATWGDLVESLIKRALGVKDSGQMIPGHGGILDRIDSLLLVSPGLLVYFTFIWL